MCVSAAISGQLDRQSVVQISRENTRIERQQQVKKTYLFSKTIFSREIQPNIHKTTVSSVDTTKTVSRCFEMED
jgi:hypothetical protein